MKYLLTALLWAHTAFAHPVDNALQYAANKNNVPYKLLKAICQVESSLRPQTIHRSDGDGTPSIGLCQIKLKTAKWLGYRGGESGLFNATTNANFAAKYLTYLLKRYRHDQRLTLAAYNAGHVRLTSTGRLLNERYVTKVMGVLNGSRADR